ncbi:hypothetical protein P3436_25565, partial [Vibrio parahaemolyticus]|nr:hypothetical protein [Vibrio parahaemolyticus]
VHPTRYGSGSRHARMWVTELNGQFTPISKTHFIPLTWSAVYQSRLFWCELASGLDIGRRDVCLLSNIMKLEGTQLVVLKVPKNTF